MWIGWIGRPVSKVAIVRVDFPDDTIAVVLEGAEIAFAIGIVRGSEIVIGTNALQDCRLVFDRRAIAEFGDGLVLQPGLRGSSSFSVALAGSLLVAASPARPSAPGFAIRRLSPDQMPEQAAHLGYGERQQIGVARHVLEPVRHRLEPQTL